MNTSVGKLSFQETFSAQMNTAKAIRLPDLHLLSYELPRIVVTLDGEHTTEDLAVVSKFTNFFLSPSWIEAP
jgi:hypothetical protein